jgi:hypothetical protein
MTERCPVCGQVAEMIWIRAHYQCAACGQVVLACCNGETAFACPLEADGSPPDATLVSFKAEQPAERIGKEN